MMEKPPPEKVKPLLDASAELVVAYGVPLGQMYTFKNGQATSREGIKDFGLERWYLEEDHYRHKWSSCSRPPKFLLIDPCRRSARLQSVGQLLARLACSTTTRTCC